MMDAEKGMPEQPVEEPSTASPVNGNKKRRNAFLAVGAVAALALIIGLSVGLTRGDKNSNSVDQAGSGPSTSPQSPGSSPTNNDAGGAIAETKFVSSTGRAFAVELDLLTNNVLEGYNGDEQALRADLNQAVRMFANGAIEDYIRYFYNYTDIVYDGPKETSVSSESGTPDGTAMGGAAGDMAMNGPSADGKTDYGTNNQEEGVDEADQVKSDGKWVFAAYGDTLVIWDAITGNSTTNYTLPAPVNTFNGGTRPVDNVFNESAGNATDGFMPIWGGWEPTAYINSMSLESNRLVLYVSGYGPEVLASMDRNSSCYGAFGTRILIFDTTQLPGAFPLLIQQDIQGDFRDSRSIGDDIHVITSCDFDLYQLDMYYNRYTDQFKGMSDDEYRTSAAAAVEPHIESFVDLIISDITVHGFPNIPKIALWQSTVGGNNAAVEEAFAGGPIQSFTSLISFNVGAIAADQELQISNAGALTPSSWGYVYAVDNMLVYAIQGWDWIPEVNGTGQTTYLLGYSLDGTTAKPSLIGSFPGYMQNQYALSIYEGYLRVATTIQSFFPIDWEAKPVASGAATDMISVVPMNDTNSTPVDVFPIESWPQQMSITKNQVLILKIPVAQGDELQEVARIGDLGGEGETITAVRYFGDIAYAVTFLQTDPFYVLSLKPDDAKVLGELKITGFSSYLHSMNEADTLLIGVGEEADVNGTTLGLQVSVFDTTDPTTPLLLNRKSVEEDLNTWSSSNVAYDFKAFRYLSLGEEVGIVILPVRVESWDQGSTGNFDGFYVYDVSRSGISLRMTISHVDSESFYNGCWSSNQLPQRSLVFNGDVTTLKGHSIVSTNLDTGAEEWKFDLPNSDTNACVMW